ncbi:MAG: type II toxin-antitoxin system VapC family toxin, partial [Pseudomonadota bacterium]
AERLAPVPGSTIDRTTSWAQTENFATNGTRLAMRVYLDANVIILIVEKSQLERELITRMFDGAARADVQLVTRELKLAEALVLPIRDMGRGSALELEYRKPFLEPGAPFELIQITLPLLLTSAEVRARTRNKLPDSIHVATAETEKCAFLVSNDARHQSEQTSVVSLAAFSDILDRG